MKIRFLLSILTIFLSTSVFAQSVPSSGTERDQSVFFFAGRLTGEFFDHSLVPFATNYEDNFVGGVGYQKFLFEPFNNLHLGVEVGLAGRFGQSFSGEAWAGLVTRYDGFVINDFVRISPSITFGLSTVTNTIGIEGTRHAQHGGNPHLLFFMSPEFSFTLMDHPEHEVFYRLHHRSGAWGTLGGFADGANAHTVGYRFNF